METLGTLVLSMYVVTPSIDPVDKPRGKHIVLARYHAVSKDEARYVKELFVKQNAHIKSDKVDGQWIVREYL
jgi:hypothetical protein